MTDNHITDIHVYRERLIDRKLWLKQLIEETERKIAERGTLPVRYGDTLRKRLNELRLLLHEVQSEIDEVSSKR